MTMWKSLLGMACCLFGLAAAADQPVSGQLGNDLFLGGGSLTVSEPVSGDLIVTGGSVDVDADVAGDTLAFGGKLRLGADIGQSVFAAGGQLTLNGRVGRNVRAAGGRIELGPKSELAGNLLAAGGQVRLLGRVRGDVRAAGGRLLIDGIVDGNVDAAGGEVELGPNARIAGRLSYRSGKTLRQDPAAQVGGGIEQLAPRIDHREDVREHRRWGVGVIGAAWTVGLMAVAALLLAAMPKFSAAVATTLRQQPGMSMLLGFVFLVCVPVAAVILFVTLIGIPLSLLALVLYLALLPVGYVFSGIGLGDWALNRWSDRRAAMLPARIAAAAAALLGLALLGWIPGVGAIVCGLALFAGIGALLLQIGRRRAAAG